VAHAQTLPAPPDEWTVIGSSNGTSSAASATRAGVSGVQHVADCVSIAGYTSGAAPVAFPTAAYLYDGETIVAIWSISLPTASAGITQVSLCGLSVPGTAGNAMTLDFGGGTCSTASCAHETVTLIGHDAT
jgi:hypothetical protein